MIDVEVRCCCRPQSLLGWIRVDELRTPIKAGRWVKFRYGVRSAVWERGPTGSPVGVVHEVSLEVGSYGTMFGEHLAFKSGELPIEELRRIPGFVEFPASLTV